MSTHRISIIGWGSLPDLTGNVFYEPFSVKATNDLWKHGHWVFNDSGTLLLLYGKFEVPKNYIGTAKIIFVWTTTATAGNVVLCYDYRAISGNDAESLDQATAQESVTVTDAAPGAANRRMEVSIALTSANMVADDTVEWFAGRDGVSASDTMAAALQLVDLLLEYDDA